MPGVPVPQREPGDGGEALGAAVAALADLTLVLRRECPWDQAQSAGTIVPHTLEEAYEVADVVREVEDAIAAGATPDLAELEEELGDLLFQVAFLAMWCGERDPSIDLGTVAGRIHAKLVRRHPHVFGDAAAAADADEVRGTWERVKREREDRGLFEGIPRAMPALGRARKMQSRAAGVGFDFGSAREALAKVEEELDELRAAIDGAERAGTMARGERSAADPRVESEVGDLLFAVANVARLARVDPELALGRSSTTFQARVEGAVAQAEAAGETFADLNLAAQEAWYQRAKAEQDRPA